MARPLILLFIGFQIILFGTSCTSTKNAVYFNDVREATFTSSQTDQQVPIQLNDILSITISSANAEASAMFNPPINNVGRTTTVTGASSEIGGYLVTADGTIQLPVLGSMKAAGLTKKQLRDNILNEILAKKLLIDPLVDIRFLNFEVTVIGEVGHPTVITVPNEKISFVKALGLAGDITIYGKKDNVMLIREANGKRLVTRIDLNSREFFESPYYYLQPNDVIYVEPNKAKVASVSRSREFLPVIISALSLVAIVLDRLLR